MAEKKSPPKRKKPIEKDYEIEKVLDYKTSDGGKGCIVRIRSLK